MSNYKTRPIGEIFEWRGVKLQVVENKSCKGCFFDGNECWNIDNVDAGLCYAKYRDDRKSVIFKRINNE